MKKYFPQFVFAVLAFLITIPFFAPGYIFLMDMVWGPNIQVGDILDDGISADFPLMIFMKVLSIAWPAETVQKLLLTSVLFLSGSLMHGLSKKFISGKWAILSGIFYMLNPWVFERFFAGQWTVLLGYAYFPFAVLKFWEFLERPSSKKFAYFVIVFSIYPIINLHWTYISLLFISLFVLVHFYSERNLSCLVSRTCVKLLEFFLVIFAIVNSFWLVGLFSAKNTFEQITLIDFGAFQTRADPDFGIFFNVLSLYGFWNGSNYLPKDMFPFWWIVSLAILAISFWGMLELAKKKHRLALSVMIAFLPALFVAVGYGNEYTKKLVDFLFLYLPGFRGLRETEKVAGFLAFSYAFFLPFGAKNLAENFSKGFGGIGKKLSGHLFFSLGVALALMSVHNIFWGFSGAIKPYEYPKTWFEVERMMLSSQQRNKILFFPWQGYPEISFAGNVKAINPASAFFSSQIVTGKGLDNTFLLETDQGIWDRKIFNIVQGVETIDLNSAILNSDRVNFIVLAKFPGWDKYGFLNEAKNLERVYDSSDITVWKILYKVPWP